jgi:UDP-N-acetylglucosamine acyltransferase
LSRESLQTLIHPTAIIDPAAELADDVVVGAYSIIGPGVFIESGCVIGPHVVIQGQTWLGKDNRVYQFASVGEDCQDKKYRGEMTRLVIGQRNVIRESVTLHRGTVQDRAETTIGDDNLLMAYVHIGHDCVIGNGTVFANNATLAGHVWVGDGAILGGFTGVHQHCRIGPYSMAAMFSAINKDVPAYVMVQGNMARARGLNIEGMRRRGYSAALIQQLQQFYKVVYRQGLIMQDACKKIEVLLHACKTQQLLSVHELDLLTLFFSSLQTSTRGILR